ncbi:hypothetical protein [Vagococcus lutrae]|uniref:hypothetical protein n=1 Tax=Vagococcus lutrae TaxID=81947 RepID=UPI00288E301C|nr:hypothetical protein [Vagococcus lutrae]MDT2844673.1 hypothetical protein [Vagococcus lutrae]
MKDKEVVSKGLSFLNMLTLIFVIAKVLGLVTFSWWLVFMPTLIQVAVVMLVFVVVMIIAASEDS